MVGLLAVPTALIGPALAPGKALLPADLLVQFEPWRSEAGEAPRSEWDPLVWDGMAQYYPWRAFAAWSLRSGVLPLWNPYQFCGTPFIANGQSAVFYPPNLIFWLAPTASAFGWSAWLHLALTGWFCYLFLRRTGTGRVGSLASAIVWQGNGFFIAWIHLPTVLCTATWLPLILLLLGKALTAPSDSRRYLSSSPFALSTAAGLVLAISYLGGHPQVFIFVSLLAAAYTIARGMSVRAASAPARAARILSTGGPAAMVSAVLCSIQLLPTLDLLRIAHRAAAPGPDSYRFFLSHAMPVPQLMGLVMPHPFGHPSLGTYLGRDNYAEFACYVGAVALALAVWAVCACRSWHARFLGVTTLVVLLIVIGSPINQPLYRWLPGFSRMGGPGRMLVLAMFGISMLAGMGVDELPRRLTARGGRVLAAPALLMAALAVAIRLWHELATPSLAQAQPALLRSASAEAVRAQALLVSALLVLAAAWRWPRSRRWALLLPPMLALDLVFAAQGHLHVSPTAWVYPPLRWAEAEASAKRRVLGNAADWPINRFPNAVLPPNAAMVYRLRDAFGYDSLYLARYRDFAAAIQHGDPSPPLNGNMLLSRLGPVYGLDMMGLAGVETVLSLIPVAGLKMERAGAYYTYSNPYARPRAWLASSAVVVPTHLDAVVSLAKLGAMPDTIIITGPEDLVSSSPRPGGGAGAEALVHDLSSNAVEVVIEGRGGPYLFLADAFAPGWRAWAGDRELPIRPAYVAFRAVALPEGATRVLFRYEPDAFRVGAFASLVAMGFISALAGWAFAAQVRQG